MHTRVLGQRFKERSFSLFYLGTFLFSFHFFFVSYFNSNFLKASGIAESLVGIVYIFGSLLTVAGILALPYVLRRFGNYKTMLSLIAAEFVLFLLLAFAPHASAFVLAFSLFLVSSSLIILSSDIFIEATVDDEKSTGSVRGAILTAVNTALVLGPLVGGFFLERAGFTGLYLIAAMLLVPFFLIIAWRFRDFTDPQYEPAPVSRIIARLQRDPDVRNIFLSHLLLRVFFSFMLIYTPLYLHFHIGFSLSQIGIMFSIMLLPFALFELPLGKIADKWIGEKEILITGFLIVILGTMSLSFITAASFAIWTTLLFITRTGASAVEIATESYFFKHVSGQDSGEIGLFRMSRPLSDIIGASLGSVVLLFVDLRFVFVILGVFLSLGILAALKIHDTK